MLYSCVHICVHVCVCVLAYALNNLGLGMWKLEVNMVSDEFFNLSPLYRISHWIMSSSFQLTGRGAPRILLLSAFSELRWQLYATVPGFFCECPGLLRPSCFPGKCLVQFVSWTNPNSLILLLLLKKRIGEHSLLEITQRRYCKFLFLQIFIFLY